LTALAAGFWFGAPAAQVGLVGVGPAEAKVYYTKKRVNGRWISGRFAKRSSRSGDAVGVGSQERSESGEGIRLSAAEASASTKSSGLPGSPVSPAQAAVISLSATAPLVSGAEADRLGDLRQALQARASALTTGSIAEGPRPAPEPQSVSLDFRSGIKTTLFSDGTIVAEPFDTAALRGLAAAPSEARTAR
jgi:hypothetical protein